MFYVIYIHLSSGSENLRGKKYTLLTWLAKNAKNTLVGKYLVFIKFIYSIQFQKLFPKLLRTCQWQLFSQKLRNIGYLIYNSHNLCYYRNDR